MNFIIDKENRRIVINSPLKTEIVINEFDKLNKHFLDGTEDIYECELILLDVDIHNEQGEIIGQETKAFARRIDRPDWLMVFNTKDYTI